MRTPLPCEFWWSVRPGSVPEPGPCSLFSIRRLLMGTDYGGINHHMPVVGIIQKDLEYLLQIPDLAQRVKRLWTLFQLPCPAGRSFHCAKLRNTHGTPWTKPRLSLVVTPTSPLPTWQKVPHALPLG